MKLQERLAGSRLFYGWVIVVVALVSMSFWLGIRSSFSVFYVALLEEFPWSRADSAGVQSVALLTYTILAPIVGHLIDRYGPTRIIVPGVVVMSIGLALCAMIDSLAEFYMLYGVLMGSGISCIGIVSYSAIIAHWFQRKRGLASGVALSGMGLGTFLLVPLSQQFIFMWGWRLTFVATGIIVFVILVPLNGFFLKHKPEEMGLFPDGLKPETEPSELSGGANGNPSVAADDWTLGKAVGTARFWAMFFFPFFSIIAIYLVLIHNIRFLVDQGMDKMTAAMIFSMVGIISSVFRIFWGGLSDRIGREKTYTMGMLCGCISLVCLILVETMHSLAFAWAFMVFFGLGWGSSAPMFMAKAADLYKGRGFGLIYGAVEAGIGFAGALGAWLGGYIFDQTQSYKGAFAFCIVVMLLSVAVIWTLAPKKTKHRPA